VVSLDEIEVKDRFRKELGDISDLAQSMEEKGMISPLAVKTQEGEKPYLLLAGERRFLAAEVAGLGEVPVRIYSQELSELEMRSIELEENIKRKDLEWIEQCNLQREIHNLQLALHGAKISTAPDAVGWSQKDTAELLGRSEGSVSMDLTLAKAIEQFPEVEWDKCKDKAEAVKVLKRIEEGALRAELASRIEKEQSVKGRDSIKKQLVESYIVGDFFEHAAKLPPKSFDLVEVDPPYSLGGRSLKDMKKKSSMATYQYGDTYNEVSDEDYEKFLENTAQTCYQLMSTHSWIIFWFAPDPWFETVYRILTETGFRTRRLCGIWTKPVGQVHEPSRYLASAYEMFFYASKGDPVLARQGRTNVFSYNPVPSQQKVHPTERPLDLMGDILNTFGMEGARTLVPFAGSGNSMIAAHRLRMSSIGFDLSKEYKDSYIVKVATL